MGSIVLVPTSPLLRCKTWVGFSDLGRCSSPNRVTLSSEGGGLGGTEPSSGVLGQAIER